MEKETVNQLVESAFNRLREIEAKNGTVVMAIKKGEVETGETFADIIKDLPEPLAQEVWFKANEEELKIEGIDVRPGKDVLTPREEINLVIEAKNELEKGNKEPLNEFIAKNDRLIYKHVFANTGRGLEKEDLEQEARLGLLRAFTLFDWKMGHKFSTYSTWWIKQAIYRAIDNKAEMIRFPLAFMRDVRTLRNAEKLLVQKFNRRPTELELAEETGFHPGKVRLINENFRQVTSTDTPIKNGDETSLTMIENIRDEKPGPEELYQNLSGQEYILGLIDRAELSAREKRIWLLYHLPEDGRETSLEEIGLKYHCTRERIRQIVNKGSRKLKFQYLRENPKAAEEYRKRFLNSPLRFR